MQVLKSLNKTYQNLQRKPVAVDLDPKAVTCDELFGIINPMTREWKDGNAGSIPGRAERARARSRRPRPGSTAGPLCRGRSAGLCAVSTWTSPRGRPSAGPAAVRGPTRTRGT